MNADYWRIGLSQAVLFSCLLGSPATLLGQVSYPMVTHAKPLAVQRGTKADLTILGQQSFAGASAVLFAGEGLSAIVTESPSDNKPAEPKAKSQRRRSSAGEVKAALQIDGNAPLGPREFRVITERGPSTVGQVVVVDAPVVVEVDKHATLESAQPIDVNRVICGAVSQREEIDYYRFQAKEGQRLTFNVLSARLMNKVHDLQMHFDPIVTLSDSTGRELAGNDDYYNADSLLHFRFPATGTYYVSVRDVRFSGDPRWVYALEITERPYVTSVFPLALPAAGQDGTLVRGSGYNLASASLKLSAATPVRPGAQWTQWETGGAVTNPVMILGTNDPLLEEKEPNDSREQATPISLPVGINGQIGASRDVDCYRVGLKKGSAIRMDLLARRLNGMLDSEIRVLDAKGNRLAINDDDRRTKDSTLVFTANADGEYTVSVRDLLGRGGPAFGYFLSIRPDVPDFEISVDDDKAGVKPGVNSAWYAKVVRRGGFAGPIDVRVEGLPESIVARSLTIPPTLSNGLILLSAGPKFAANQPASARFVRVVGSAQIPGADGKPRVVEHLATSEGEIYLPGGGRGLWEVETQIAATQSVTDLTSVKVTPAVVSLKPGEKATLTVEVQRSADFQGAVTLDPRLRHLGSVYADPLPPGVKALDSGAKTQLGPKETKGTIVLECDRNAKPIENVPICVLANVSVNFVVKRAYASDAVLVSVKAP